MMLDTTCTHIIMMTTGSREGVEIVVAKNTHKHKNCTEWFVGMENVSTHTAYYKSLHMQSVASMNSSWLNSSQGNGYTLHNYIITIMYMKNTVIKYCHQNTVLYMTFS